MMDHRLAPPSATDTAGRRRPAPFLARRAWARGRFAALGRLVALLLFLFASPGINDVLRDVAAAACGGECQGDDGCEGEGALGCLRSCSHCGCCAHSNPAPVPSELALLPPAFAASAPTWRVEQRKSSGYRAPPFRPPAALARTRSFDHRPA